MTGSKNLATVGPGQFLQALNISYEMGTVNKEGGSSKYNAAAIAGAPSVIGGWDWWPDTSTQRMVIMTSAGWLQRDNGAGTFPVTLMTGMTTSGVVPVFVEGGQEAAAQNRKLFIFTGNSPVQVLSGDGGTTSSLTTPPADWSGTNQPIGGCIHEGRLWGWGNLNDPHRVYASSPTDHEDFSGAITFAVYPGEGERIIAGCSYKGLLILWKTPRGIYVIDTSDNDTTKWRVTRLSQSVGIASPVAWCQVDDDILSLDANGNFQFLSATSSFGDLASRNLSTAARMDVWFRDNINFSRLFNARAIYYPIKREAHFALAAQGDTTNTRRCVVDFNRPDLPRFRWSDKDTCEALWLKKDTDLIGRPMSGGTAGFVWNLDQTVRSKDGEAYLGRFQTAHTDFSYVDPVLASKVKLGDFLELIFEPKGDLTLYVDVVWDGVPRQTIPFTMGFTDVLLDDFMLDEDFLTGSTQVRNIRKRIVGSGRRLSLIAYNNRPAEDFSLAKFLFYFRVGDERTFQ